MIQTPTPNQQLTLNGIHDAIKSVLIQNRTYGPVAHELMNLQTDESRLICIDKLFRKYNVRIPLLNSIKDDSKSQEISARANQLYTQNKYTWALHLYNESIALASQGSESIALAYGNRSAISLHMEKYTSCLEDIERAEKNGYPSHAWPKLNLRRAKCEELLKNKPAPVTTMYGPSLELLRGPNAQIPCASAALTLHYSEGWGRHVIANDNIVPGDILAIEPAYCTVIAPSHRYIRCSNCLATSLVLIPCPNCTEAMFCDEICLKEAMEKHHKIECTLTASASALMLCEVQYMSLRTAVRALCDYNWDIDALRVATKDIEKQAETNKKTAGFTKSSDENMTYDSDSYAAIHCLVSNSDKHTPSSLFYSAVIANVLLQLFRHLTDIGRSFNDVNAIFFGGLILRHLQISSCNMSLISEMQFEGSVHIGVGAFAFSLLNHSCVPNIFKYARKLNRRRVMVTVATAPIKPGEQIYDNYGYLYALVNRKRRRELLQSIYVFECTCVACLENYPLYEKLPSLAGVPRAPLHKREVSRLKRLDKKLAAQKFNESMGLLRELGNSKPFPNTQVCDLEECAKLCWGILSMDE